MNMKFIDYNKWDRKDIFEFFSGIPDPFYMVTYKEDVTELRDYVKKHNLSFYLAMTYVICRSINDVDAFHYCLHDQKIAYLPERRPSFTDLEKGSDHFKIVNEDLGDDLVSFVRRAKEKSMNQKDFLIPSEEGDNLIYITCLPWLKLTALHNEGLSDKDDSIPRVSWGQYEEEKGRTVIGLSFEVNHRFIDGVHLGQVHQNFRNYLEKLK